MPSFSLFCGCLEFDSKTFLFGGVLCCRVRNRRKVCRFAMYIGYARVSTKEQHLDLQILALKKAGCKRIFKEKISGKAKYRPALNSALEVLGRGDTLIVWHLDRLGRTARELINMEYGFKREGIELISLTQNIDTKTPIGEYHFHVTCANAQLESARISERTRAGLDAAKLQGRFPGRPRRLTEKQMQTARLLALEKHLTIAELAARFHVGQSTIWRALQGKTNE